jgi:hypothetical protein
MSATVTPDRLIEIAGDTKSPCEILNCPKAKICANGLACIAFEDFVDGIKATPETLTEPYLEPLEEIYDRIFLGAPF